MKMLTSKLSEQMLKVKELDEAINQNLKKISYEIK